MSANFLFFIKEKQIDSLAMTMTILSVQKDYSDCSVTIWEDREMWVTPESLQHCTKN